jgi:DNA-binding MarR family transcriptional regulator
MTDAAPDTPPALDPLRLDSQLCFAVYGAAHAFAAAYKPVLEPLGLTYPQYLVMLVLWEGDNLTVGQIGERLHLDSGTLTPLLKRLEAAGLVGRHRDRADERLVRVRLSEKGQSLKAGAAEVRRGVGCATGLGVEGIEALRSDLVRLRESLDQALGGREP